MARQATQAEIDAAMAPFRPDAENVMVMEPTRGKRDGFGRLMFFAHWLGPRIDQGWAIGHRSQVFVSDPDKFAREAVERGWTVMTRLADPVAAKT